MAITLGRWATAGMDRYVEPEPEAVKLTEGPVRAMVGRASVYDFGCGFGRHAVFFDDLLKKPDDYLGVDIAPHRILRNEQTFPWIRFAHIRDDRTLWKRARAGSGWIWREDTEPVRMDVALADHVLLHVKDSDIGDVVTHLCEAAPEVVVCEKFGSSHRGLFSYNNNRDEVTYAQLFALNGRELVAKVSPGGGLSVTKWA